MALHHSCNISIFSWVNHSLSVMFIFHLSSDKYKSLLIAKLKKMHTDNGSFFLNCLLIKAVHVLIDQYLWFNRSFWQLGFFVRRCQFSCSVIYSFNYNSTVYRWSPICFSVLKSKWREKKVLYFWLLPKRKKKSWCFLNTISRYFRFKECFSSDTIHI